MDNLSALEEDKLIISTGEVAEMLNAHPSSIKRWSASGELACVTTPGGHRRFTLEEVRRFSKAAGIGFQFAPLEEDLEPYVHALRSTPQELDEVLRSLLYRWLREGYTPRLEWALMHLHRSRYTIGGLFDRLIAPVLVRVGLAWQRGEITVAHEHFMSQQLYEAMHRLRPDVSEQTGARPLAVCAGAENVQHVFGLMAARLILEHLGWSVMYLGTSVPDEDLVDLIIEKRPSVVTVAFGPSESVSDVRRTVAALGGAAGQHRFALALGGKPTNGFAFPRQLQTASAFRSLASFETWALEQSLLLQQSGRKFS